MACSNSDNFVEIKDSQRDFIENSEEFMKFSRVFFWFGEISSSGRWKILCSLFIDCLKSDFKRSRVLFIEDFSLFMQLFR